MNQYYQMSPLDQLFGLWCIQNTNNSLTAWMPHLLH